MKLLLTKPGIPETVPLHVKKILSVRFLICFCCYLLLCKKIWSIWKLNIYWKNIMYQLSLAIKICSSFKNIKLIFSFQKLKCQNLYLMSFWYIFFFCRFWSWKTMKSIALSNFSTKRASHSENGSLFTLALPFLM